MSIIRKACAAALLLMHSSDALLAQSCSFSITNMSWGAIDLGLGVNHDLAGTLTASCTGLSLLTVRVCPSLGSGSGGANASGSERYMMQGSDLLRYNLYSDAARSTVWGSYFWGAAPIPPTVDVPLNALGSGSVSRTIYGRVFSGQASLRSGTYSSSFAGVNTQITYRYSTFGSCATIGSTNATQVPFTASAIRIGSCTVSATDLNFGNYGVLNSNIDAANSITVNCTPQLSYTIGLDGGVQGASDPTQRKMTNVGNSSFVTYGLYKDASRAQPWGTTSGQLVSGTGTGANQMLSVFGRVPAQSTPSPDTYTDTIVITVTY